MDKYIWATETMKEVPFWHDDITQEEYEAEREHYMQMMSTGRAKEYQPLWVTGEHHNE